MNRSEPYDAFSHGAAAYDAAFTHTPVGVLQRERVWQLATSSMPHPPARVLELNCGSGEDACWLAERGYRVWATDRSPAMIEVARAKSMARGLSNRVNTGIYDISEPIPFEKEDFDLVFSNFGGFNCLNPDQLKRAAAAVATALDSGNRAIIVLMGRFCWQETLYFLLKGRFRSAFRRLSRGPVQARLDGGTYVNTWYYAPHSFARYFPDMQVKAIEPVGFWLPPSYLNPFFSKRLRLLRALTSLERRTSGAWFALAADHYFICLEKK